MSEIEGDYPLMQEEARKRFVEIVDLLSRNTLQELNFGGSEFYGGHGLAAWAIAENPIPLCEDELSGSLAFWRNLPYCRISFFTLRMRLRGSNRVIASHKL